MVEENGRCYGFSFIGWEIYINNSYDSFNSAYDELKTLLDKNPRIRGNNSTAKVYSVNGREERSYTVTMDGKLVPLEPFDIEKELLPI